MDESNKSILERSIQKAIDSGWQPASANDAWDWCDAQNCRYTDTGCIVDYSGESASHLSSDDYLRHANTIIFNHDFAKALWGEEFIPNGWVPFPGTGEAKEVMQVSWSVHLQQIVIADDPIKYLGEHL